MKKMLTFNSICFDSTFLRQSFLILISTICFNCSQTSRVPTHEKLISSESAFIMGDGDHATGYYTDHENFIKRYFSEKQSGDTLILTTLKEINACSKTVGDIRISRDTLFLEIRRLSGESCASVTFNKFTYKIDNPSKKKYIIKSLK